MTADGDAHSAMLSLAVDILQREAGGRSLSAAERIVTDFMWIGTQVAPNGFHGWLAYTSCERMRATLKALAELGCTEVAESVLQALAVAELDPARMTDEERERRLDGLTEEELGRLAAIDWKFHDAYESSMALCQRYALEHDLL